VDDGVIASGALDLARLNPPWLASTRGKHRPGDLYWCEGIFPVAPGGNMALRRSDFWAIGGFAADERTLEDFDFAMRAWERGVTVRPAGFRATVLYRLRASARALFRQGYRYGRARSDVYAQLWERRLVRRWSFSGWKSWVLLLAYLPAAIASRRKRLVLCWIAGNRLGRLAGSLAGRVVYL
jgi:GT2 family glycosyltransferase